MKGLIDCFYCTVGGDRLRQAMGELTLARLEQLPVNVTVLTPEFLGCSKRDFQVGRRTWAEEVAETHIYIVADDDCLLMEPDWVERGLSVLDSYPTLAQLSGYPTNATIYPTGDNHANFQFHENQSICGTYFQRKGLMTEFPPLSEHSYSRTQADWFRSNGYVVGLTPLLHFNHLGEGFSQWHL